MKLKKILQILSLLRAKHSTDNNVIYISHAGGTFHGLEYTNSLEALNNSYRRGFKFIEVDLEWSSDGQLILLHDWNSTFTKLFKRRPGPCTLREFAGFRGVAGLTPMTFRDLAAWVKAHPDVSIIVDTKTKTIASLQEILDTYPETVPQIIPQVYTEDEFRIIAESEFSRIIYSDYKNRLPRSTILKLGYSKKLYAVTFPKDRVYDELSFFRKRTFRVFTHPVNSRLHQGLAELTGIGGIYTSTLRPRGPQV